MTHSTHSNPAGSPDLVVLGGVAALSLFAADSTVPAPAKLQSAVYDWEKLVASRTANERH